MTAVAKNPDGLAARLAAVELIRAVLVERRSLDQAFATLLARRDFAGLAPRDRALARAISATTLRRHGQIEDLLARFITRPLPAKRGALGEILSAATAQVVFLQIPAHAAIDLAVRQVKRDRAAWRFAKLANAVLRRVAREGAAIVEDQDAARLNTPDWMWRGWCAAYGEEHARAIAAANLTEAALDLTVKSDADHWCRQLGASKLPTGTLRLEQRGRIDRLAGFGEGAWWVQDAAAALPARLFGAVAGKSIADLCAAPGGKSAQLAAAGAMVTSVDNSARRLSRLEENLSRLGLASGIIQADASDWAPGRTFDGVLVDAPCLATGTIRRHPDILHLKRPGDLAELVSLQSGLLANAARLVEPGGLLVYCTCSLESQEGPERIEAFLADQPAFVRYPIDPGELGAPPEWIDPAGQLRTRPDQLGNENPRLAGIDGFFAARLERLP